MAVQATSFKGLVPYSSMSTAPVYNGQAVTLPEPAENFVYLHRHRPNDPKSVIDAYTDVDRDNDDLGFLQRSALKAIAWYQKTFRTVDENGVAHNKFFFCQCTPSCSSYTAQAIREDGAIMGTLKGMWRVCVTCNPVFVKLKYGKWNVGSGAIYDPVKRKPRLIDVPDPLNGGPRFAQAPWARRGEYEPQDDDMRSFNGQPTPWATNTTPWGILPPPEAWLPQPAYPQLVGYSPVYAYPNNTYNWDPGRITQNGFDSAYGQDVPPAETAPPRRWRKASKPFEPRGDY